MKKLLPKTVNNPQGFTLIELLVVIAIIAVLAIMGFAAFRGFTGRGNNARRNADFKAIGDALEANKSPSFYTVLANSQFASGVVPVDPVGGAGGVAAHGGYCFSYATTGTLGSAPTTAQLYTGVANGCNSIAAAGVGAGTSWSSVAAGVPTGNVTIWMVCGTTGDDGVPANNTVVCRNSAQ